MIDWSTIDEDSLAGSEELQALLARIAQAVGVPELRERCDELLQRALVPPLDGTTFDLVQNGLTTLFGLGDDEPGRLFAWVAWDRTRGRLEAMVAVAPPVVGRFLRDVWALHGDALIQAYRRWREVPDDWEVVNREIYHDLLTQQIRIETLITKFNGEQIRLAGDAISLLALTTNLLRSLNVVPPGTQFPERVLIDFREQVAAFETLLAGPALPAGDGAAQEGAAQA